MTNKIQIIAEVGQAHEGSLGIAHSYIDALSDTGIDAIKWQTHIAEAESSVDEPFRIKFSYEDKTRIEYWKRMEFSIEQWKQLKKHCNEKGIEFISSPFSNYAVDILHEIGVNRYKIGSGEVTNSLILEKIARTKKPVLLSTGMSSFNEIDGAVNLFKTHKIDYSLLQCTTSYPTSSKEWGLNVIAELKERYNVPIGFSDHSGDIYACIAAASLGAKILEFHVVFDKRMFGPDSKASITIDQVKMLTEGVRKVENALKNPIDKNNISKYYEIKNIFEKSLAVNRDMQIGEEIKFEDLEAKKPKNKGIPANEYKKIIGKKLISNIKAWSFLNYNNIK